MQRVAIIGPGGAGKSTLARELGERTALPVIHLDREYWRPGWDPTPEPEWRARVTELAAADRWILDGNYGGTMALRFARADTVIYLDFPRRRYLPRAIKRRFQHRGRSRPDMADGCEERLDPGFLKWLWNWPREARVRAEASLVAASPAVEIIRLRNPREVTAFLRSVQRAASAPP